MPEEKGTAVLRVRYPCVSRLPPVSFYRYVFTGLPGRVKGLSFADATKGGRKLIFNDF